MKTMLALLLMGFALCCVFGFLASAEVSDPAEKLRWQSSYIALGVVSFLAVVTLLFGKRDSNSSGPR